MNKPYPQTGAAYFGNRYLDHAKRDLARIAEVCDHIVHTVSENDLYFHKAALGRIFEATRKAGLEIWADPWGLGGVFGGESFSKFLLEHTDQWQVLSNGKRVPAACINQPAFRGFVQEWLLVAQGLGAQVIFWDEPHVFFHWDLEWEGVYSCVCDRCKSLFQKKYGHAPSGKLDEEALDFRRDSLADFLGEAMALAKERGMRNALCLYAFSGYGAYEKIWETLGSIPELDIFGCDPYWRWRPAKQDPATHVKEYTDRVTKITVPLKKESQIWFQAMRLPKGAEGEIAQAVRSAAAAGAQHITAWSYDGGALLDPVLAEDPEAVWKATADIFRELRGGRK